MKLKIKITKQILEESKMCGTEDCLGRVSENCAIALAVREIFPKASVQYSAINPFGIFSPENEFESINLPNEAIEFIRNFDIIGPRARVRLPNFEFEVDVPERIINSISLPEIEKIISNSKTLEIVTN